jgi:hypothetical protein
MSGNGGTAPPFLISGLDISEWSASQPSRFIIGKEPPVPYPMGIHWTGDWVGPRAGVDAVLSFRESNPGRPARRYTD